MLQRKFDNILEGLFPDGGAVLLAISGGSDSICMAELFRNTSVRGVSFAVAHCNFHLRREESDGDAAMVEKWSNEAGIRFHKADFDTEEYASSHSVSIEMAARELRYGWFARLCKSEGYDALAVAHNANDNAETLILNLLRGTGLRGLCGIRSETTVPVAEPGLGGVRLVRPLLSVSREEISAFLNERGIVPREDRTNAETLYKRNKIRHLVLPVFGEINPSFLDTFSRETRHFEEEWQILDEYYRNAVGDILLPVRDGELRRVDLDGLRRQPHLEYILYRLLEPYGFRDGNLSVLAGQIKSGEELAGKRFDAQDGYALIFSSGSFSVIPSAFAGPQPECVVIRGEGEYMLGGRKITVSVLENAEPSRKPEVMTLNASAVSFPLVIRTWQPGDWFVPFGMRGRKKLSDWFTDRKSDALDKRASLVVCSPAFAKGDISAANPARSAGKPDGANGGVASACDSVTHDVINTAGADTHAAHTSSDSCHIAAVIGYTSGRRVSQIDDSLKIVGKQNGVVRIEVG